ncbi:hypothetical protein PF023_02300 [Enterococcus thailandicus]|uniref:CAT RNA binding domain-containing protein n=2 Tax=Enterococcus TaxID=1350 RepID=UPI0022EBD445|nr:CAT RNA binding domain-containing protein [Enterococcus thailandicus]MDA3972865.1 hypothetical protein [Enterococcus thailandicus]MDA3975701.1 hypothetical protein [Enterococcus thailandicus]MDA3980325.1 hypothetical protein [Enterococcus thailandicus]
MQVQVILILNHNAVVARSKKGEWVLIRRGIGFGKKVGDLVEPKNVECMYQKISI